MFVLLGNYLVKNSRHAWSLFGAVSDERNIYVAMKLPMRLVFVCVFVLQSDILFIKWVSVSPK